MINNKSHVFSSPFVFALALFVGFLSTEIRAEDWIDCAAKKIESAIDEEKNSAVIAQAILSYTHPTGNNPVISSVETAKSLNGNSLTVTITLNWNGGIVGTNYTTVVSWKCNQTRHISAAVTSDNASFGVSTTNRLRLNTYFQETFDAWFPAVRR